MKDKYIPPAFNNTGFHCPYCHVYSDQIWYDAGLYRDDPLRAEGKIREFFFSYCTHCRKYAAWHETEMIFPFSSPAPFASDDMPDNVKSDFEEARDIVSRSPRSACALLRLAIQELMVHLGERGEDLNTDIGNLVKKGLPVRVQKALDSVRVVGNNAVHPGELDLTDDVTTAVALFDLINMVIEVMITQPKEVEKIFEKVPSGAKKAIERRDQK